MFDPFDKGLPHYTFTPSCREDPEVTFDDDIRFEFFNCLAAEQEKNESIRQVLSYFAGGSPEGNLARDVQEGRENKKRVGIIGLICGILAFLFCLEFTLVSVGGIGGVASFIDFPTLIMIVGFTLGIELIAGRIKRVFKALGAAVKNTGDLDENTRKIYLQDLKFFIRTTIISGFITAIIGFINLLHNMDNPATIGPSLGVMLIVVFYASIIIAVVFALRERLKA